MFDRKILNYELLEKLNFEIHYLLPAENNLQ